MYTFSINFSSKTQMMAEKQHSCCSLNMASYTLICSVMPLVEDTFYIKKSVHISVKSNWLNNDHIVIKMFVGTTSKRFLWPLIILAIRWLAYKSSK